MAPAPQPRDRRRTAARRPMAASFREPPPGIPTENRTIRAFRRRRSMVCRAASSASGCFPTELRQEGAGAVVKVKGKYASDPVGDPSHPAVPCRHELRVLSCLFPSIESAGSPRNPKWENISGNIGAQYLRISGVFGNLLSKNNFVFHILESQPPGTVDTSLVASDNINNPNTMNSVFNLAQRVLVGCATRTNSSPIRARNCHRFGRTPRRTIPTAHRRIR